MSATTLKMLSWNVNGLRAAYKKGFLDWFQSQNADIVCLQETKATESQLPAALQKIDGYHTFYCSGEKGGYSGTALYTKIEPFSVTRGFGMGEKFDTEGRTLIADYGPFVLFNIYFPNGKTGKERLDYKMEFYGAFLSYAEGVRKAGKEVIVCGDVNTAHKEIDIARPKANEKISGFLPEERAWMDVLVSHGYIDTFRLFNQEPEQYTWWDEMTKARARNVGWRIDYFFVSQGLKPYIRAATIHADVMGSDHCPVGLEIALPGAEG